MDIKDLDPKFRASAILAEYDRVPANPQSITFRRNCARTLYDSLKPVFRVLGWGRMNDALGDIDVVKRFRFLLHDYPELQEFEALIRDCKKARDRVEHSDDKGPEWNDLVRWRANIDKLLAAVDEATRTRAKRISREMFDKNWVRIALDWELENKNELANEFVDNLRRREVPEEELEKYRQDFLTQYSEYAPYSSLEEAQSDTQLHLESDYEIAAATVFVARMNGYASASVNEYADLMFRHWKETSPE